MKDKTHWHYGLIKHVEPYGTWYAIHEIYQGEKVGWTTEPIKLVSEDVASLQHDLELMLQDIKTRDVLIVDENNNLLRTVNKTEA
jgi:hypothetical protein